MSLNTELLTTKEVAIELKVSTDSIIRWFAHRSGVIDLGKGEKMHKRRYRELRIPRSVLNLFLVEKTI